MKPSKLLAKARRNPANIRFADMLKLVESFEFVLDRIEGSHHIFKRQGIPKLVNLQNFGGKAKDYQVKQFLKLVDEYHLTLKEETDE